MADPELRKLSYYFASSKRKGREGLPLMSVTMHNGLVRREDLERDKERKTKSSLEADEHLLVEPGDIAYNMMRMWQGALGLAAEPANVSPAYGVMRPKPTVDPRFAAHWFKSEYGLYMLWAYSYGLTNDRLRLYPKDFLQIPVLWPDPLQQTRIAAVLDEWDNEVAAFEKLIEQKEQRKSALAMQLLGPAVEPEVLPGWKTFRLGELFKERNETSPDAELLSITANRGIIRRDDTERKDSSAADKSKYKRVRVGDIGYNTMRMWQGVSALSSLDGIVSPAYTIVTPKGQLDGDFAAHLFKLPAMIHLFWRYSQGLVDDTLSLKFPHFSQIKISVPPTKQQSEIARFLSAQDEEILQLEKLVALRRTQKRGLMQKLLTGQRVVPESIDALLPKAEEQAA